MKKTLFLECSPFGNTSSGTRLVQAALRERGLAGDDLPLITRSLAAEPLAPLSARYAQALTSAAPDSDPALAVSERLISELEACDRLLIATPMHNFTVPAALKLWIDYVLRIERSFTNTPEGKVGLLRDRPTLVLVRSGGICTGDAARQPDFLTPYLRHTLATVGIHRVQFVYLPGQPVADEALNQAQRALAAFLAEAPLANAQR